MATLIDADELKLELKWLEIDTPVYHDVMSTIDEIATVDPVKHGHWVMSNGDYEWECSSCGGGLSDYKTAYCPDCGAKMDELVMAYYGDNKLIQTIEIDERREDGQTDNC